MPFSQPPLPNQLPHVGTVPAPQWRAARKAATRQALLDAAVACFARDGAGATSIQDITRAAGVAQGTFYVHFADKEALLDELLRLFNADRVVRLAAAWDASTTQGPQAFLTRAAAEFIGQMQRHATFVRAYTEIAAAGLDPQRLRDGINPPARAFLHQALAGWATMRSAAAGAASAPTLAADIDLTAHGLLALWLRLGLQVVLGNADRPHTEALLVRLSVGMLDAVFAAPAASDAPAIAALRTSNPLTSTQTAAPSHPSHTDDP